MIKAKGIMTKEEYLVNAANRELSRAANMAAYSSAAATAVLADNGAQVYPQGYVGMSFIPQQPQMRAIPVSQQAYIQQIPQPEQTMDKLLVGNRQDIRIESYDDRKPVPKAVEDLAYDMLTMNDEIRDVVNEIRNAYAAKKDTFCISVGKSASGKKIEKVLQSMYGIAAGVYYNTEKGFITGRLVNSNMALKFINGDYMEIAVCKVVRESLNRLEKKYGVKFTMHTNVKVANSDGSIKNEFDIVIENVTSSVIYVIEVKSGKTFKNFDKLAKTGREYGIVPNRLLLVDSFLTDQQVDMIEYFCEYYVANMKKDSLESKIKTMLEADVKTPAIAA